MQTRTKVFTGLVTAGLLYYLLRDKSKIQVLKTNVGAKSVEYYMEYEGQAIKDTFVLGDIPNIVPVGDGIHYFAAIGDIGLGIVELSIGFYESNGGFKSIKSHLISF